MWVISPFRTISHIHVVFLNANIDERISFPYWSHVQCQVSAVLLPTVSKCGFSYSLSSPGLNPRTGITPTMGCVCSDRLFRLQAMFLQSWLLNYREFAHPWTLDIVSFSVNEIWSQRQLESLLQFMSTFYTFWTRSFYSILYYLFWTRSFYYITMLLSLFLLYRKVNDFCNKNMVSV